MGREHDFDAAWKSILEVFEKEIVELLFPELYNKIAWDLGTESLDNELREIQKEIFDKENGNKIISDKILKVKLKENESKILFIHVEVQSYSKGNKVFGERMFRYFYRIWDKFRYVYKDKSEIVGAAIYTYKGNEGKDKNYIYSLPEIEEAILTYNFKTIDVESINLENINEENPLKLVFKIGKKLLNTKMKDEDILKAKIELAEELNNYDKIKNDEQIRALVDFLEYLFLIENPEYEKKYEEYKLEKGGKLKMSIDEIREQYFMEKGMEKGIEKGRIEAAIEMLKDGQSVDKIEKYLKLPKDTIEALKQEILQKV